MNVVLVDPYDRQIGVQEKLQAHKEGNLHRALSVYLFNGRQVLLQQRANAKYHSPGLWANATCGHHLEGEEGYAAAQRCLYKEMGISTKLEYIKSLVYNVEVPPNLVENEYLYIFRGEFNGTPELNRNEAQDYAWVDAQILLEDLRKNPELYTPWFRLIAPKVIR